MSTIQSSPAQFWTTAWFKHSLGVTLLALGLTFVPVWPVALVGGLSLLIILPGGQLSRGLGLYRHWRDGETLILSAALGLVTTPLLIYWGSLVLGYHRPLLIGLLPVYILILAGLVARSEARAAPPPATGPTWPAMILASVTALGVSLAYFELNTAQGYYPVQMEDWQKHYGVLFALRHTGMPPTSLFFYGLFPHEPLIYYYFLHLNGASLEMLLGGAILLHTAFVIIIVSASLIFSGMVWLLARTLFGSRQAATWSLAFATLIGSLDILPIVRHTINRYREHFPTGTIPAEVFIPREHIDNWISALSLRMNGFYAHHVWVPQHLTGLTIICLGCYLYLTVTDRRKLLLILPGLLFALLGFSTWITVIIALCLFLFALWQIIATHRQPAVLGLSGPRLFLAYAFIALTAGLIAAPFIAPLLGPNAPQSGIVFEIPRLDGWWLFHPVQAYFGPSLWAKITDLPLHFLIEHGALLIAGLSGLALFYRHQGCRADSLLPFFGLLVVMGSLTVSCFASGRGWAELGLIQNNDLGLRAFMPGQLVLALFAGYFMAGWPILTSRPWLNRSLQLSLIFLIGLGVTSSAWEFVSMGLAKYTTDPRLSPTVYQTLRDLPTVTPPIDKPLPVVQHRLHRDVSRFQLSLGSRPVSFSTGEAIVFHQHVHELALAHQLSQQAFDNGLPVWSYQMFYNLGANYIFVGPAEREAMRHPEKYRHDQYFQPVYENGDFSIYRVQPWAETRQPAGPLATPLATFDEGRITFAGYFIDHQPAFPGQPESSPVAQGLVTAWQLSQTVDKDYTTFIHVVDEATGEIVAQADHQLWAWDVQSEGPTTSWSAKLLHLDIYPLPPLPAEATLTIRLGLWLPATGQQFAVESTTLPVDEAGRLVVGEITTRRD